MVAIVPVVLYHAGVPFLPGGFIGVDVFFVISGFLITGILHREITQERFSLVGFYERRARRILPALAAVMFASVIAGLVMLSPTRLVDLSQSAIATAAFVSNVWFWITTADYFSLEAEFQPLLHTWSLAVEEQFYILFPLLLWLLARWPRRVTLWAVATLTGLSFALAILGVAREPSASFFLAPTRGWELGLGALLALGIGPTLTARWLRELVAFAGLAAILVAAMVYDASTPFPGAAALLPCLGAAALISAGAQGRSLASRLLSFKPIAFVGLISYSLYLWHWPILAYLRVYLDDRALPPALAAAAVVAAFAAAVLSWAYVERPFRRRPPRGFGRAAIFALSGTGTSAAVVIAAGIWLSDGLPLRFPADVMLAYAGTDDASPDRERCFDVWPESGLCRIGAATESEGPADFLLWGDSHAVTMLSGVADAARRTGRTGLFAGYQACPPVLGVRRVDQGPRHDCSGFNAAVLAELRGRRDVPLVILAARWALTAEGHRAPNEDGKPALLAWAGRPDPGPYHPERNFAIFKQAIAETVAAIRSTGRRVIILGNVPEIGWDVPSQLGNHLLWGHALPNAPTLASASRRQSRADSVLAGLADPPDVHFLSLAGLLCDPACRTSLEGRPLYLDDDHLSSYGSVRIIGSLFREKVWR